MDIIEKDNGRARTRTGFKKGRPPGATRPNPNLYALDVVRRSLAVALKSYLASLSPSDRFDQVGTLAELLARPGEWMRDMPPPIVGRVEDDPYFKAALEYLTDEGSVEIDADMLPGSGT